MIEKEAMYKISYGLFVLTTTDGEKQNGCIVNTVSMITDNPKRIVVFVNKANYSEELLRKEYGGMMESWTKIKLPKAYSSGLFRAETWINSRIRTIPKRKTA